MSNPLAQHSGGFTSQSVIVIVCSTLGLYNALELLLLIFTTFKTYSGLYFWALLIASFGVIPYIVGWLIVYFSLTHNWVGFIIDSYGWVTMVTGQSVVLYSRLHLVLRNPNILRVVKWMIIIDAIIFHVSTTVVLFGSNIGEEETNFNNAWNVIEKVQMTGFCIQEFVISGLYVWKTVELLQVVKKSGTKRVMWQLFLINVIIIAMDIALLALEYRNLRTLEQAFKVVIYSIKLKLEFAILGKLVEIVQQSGRSASNAFADAHEYVDETKASNDLTLVASTAKRNNSYARPQWLDDFDKTNTFQHVEKVEDGRLDLDEKPHAMSHEIDPYHVPLTDDSISRAPNRARTRTNSDLMYAEAMRSISSV